MQRHPLQDMVVAFFTIKSYFATRPGNFLKMEILSRHFMLPITKSYAILFLSSKLSQVIHLAGTIFLPNQALPSAKGNGAGEPAPLLCLICVCLCKWCGITLITA
jgi:hypothetical protein